MVERIRLSSKASARISDGGNYFGKPKSREFVRSGCKVLDLVLGGGWAEGRIANIIGDKSSGKTLLCIEAAANFDKKYKSDGRIFYREVEAAFDTDYAEALGMPVERVDFGENAEPIFTVEDLFEDMERTLDAVKDMPSLYIVDSLDALSDREELSRTIDKGTYGTNKPKKIGELFRRLTQRMAKANMTMIIVSQVRSKIGITFGETTTRSGGRALDFYSSQFIKLAHMGIINRTVSGLKRAAGVEIRAKSTKNKIGLPFRDCQFNILFGYGIDDMEACLGWLSDSNSLKDAGFRIIKGAKNREHEGVYGSFNAMVNDFWGMPNERFDEELKRIRDVVEKRWWEIEMSTLPTRRKY